MSMSRRDFLNAGVMAGASVACASWPGRALAQAVRQPGMYFDWKPLAMNAKVAFGAGGNVLAVMSRAQSLLIDCKNLGCGQTLRREAREVGAEVAAVINTHHHGDHSGGNAAFTRVAPLVAQRNASDRIVQNAQGAIDRFKAGGEALAERQVRGLLDQSLMPGGAKRASVEFNAFFRDIDSLEAELFAPTQTFAEEHEVIVGDLRAELRHVGAGHTDNDAFVFIPDLNILHTGDLVFHRLHPYFDAGAGADSAGWMRSCDAMLELCDDETVVVPGHGEITDRSAIVEQKRYFELLRDTMAAAVDEGKSRAEAIAIELPDLSDYGFRQIKDVVFGSVYDELSAS